MERYKRALQSKNALLLQCQKRWARLFADCERAKQGLEGILKKQEFLLREAARSESYQLQASAGLRSRYSQAAAFSLRCREESEKFKQEGERQKQFVLRPASEQLAESAGILNQLRLQQEDLGQRLRRAIQYKRQIGEYLEQEEILECVYSPDT